MRTNHLLATLVTLAFLALAAGAAAQPPADQQTREERRQALQQARQDALRMFQENRTAAFEVYHSEFNATKARFLANKAKVQADCEAKRNATTGNATPGGGDNNTGQCMRDGLKPYIEEARAEHRAQKQELRAALLDAREAAKAAFQARAKAMARNAG